PVSLQVQTSRPDLTPTVSRPRTEHRELNLAFGNRPLVKENCSPLTNYPLISLLLTNSGWRRPSAAPSVRWKRAKCPWEPSWCAKGVWWDEDGIAISPTAIQPLRRKSWPCARRDETSVTTGSSTASCLLQLSRAPCARGRQFMPASAAWYMVPTIRRQAPSIRYC